MTKTKTIQHEYGSETIEVAECDSCGQQTKVGKMREFRIYGNEFEDYISGSICPSCRGLENPLEYPSPERTIKDLLGIVVGLFLLLLTAFVCLLILTKITEFINNLSGTLPGLFLMSLISLVFASIIGNILGFTEE